MPYKDIEKQRAAVRTSMQKKRAGDSRYYERGKDTARLYKQDHRSAQDHRDQERARRYEQRRAAPFIALDGEGITNERGDHLYVFLAASTGETITNRNGLGTVECFDFLLSLKEKYPQAIFCCFGASYDVTKMLRDIPHETLQELWENRATWNTSVDWHGYALSYVARKSFIVRRYGSPRGRVKSVQHRDGAVTQAWEPNYEASITLWDVIGFFQGKFPDVLETWFADRLDGGVITFEDGARLNLGAMRTMKQARSTFAADQLDESIIPYCQNETVALAHLMERLRGLLQSIGIELSRWDGVGAGASAILSQHAIKEAIHERIPDDRLSDAQRRAYAGGRIELGQFGTYLGRVYNCDIRSAYPDAMRRLPTLTGGLWRHTTGASTRPYSLARVRWHFDENLPYYPFFYRESDGTIYFPPSGEGWYWKPELDAALRAHSQGKLSTEEEAGSIEVVESWEFAPATQDKPFAFIQELFDHRKQLKAEGRPGEKVLKFTINCLYGKTVQAAGGSSANPPAYHNMGWAGYTTSFVRAKIFDAIMQAPAQVVSVNTDGVYATTPLALLTGDGLGDWKETIADGIVAVQAGIFWTMTRLDREPVNADQERFWQHAGNWYAVDPHYRGFNKATLSIDTVIDGWRMVTEVEGRDRMRLLYTGLDIPTMRFIGLGSACASHTQGRYWPLLGQWVEEPRALKLFPMMKRIYSALYEPGGVTPYPHKQLLMTHAVCPTMLDGGRGICECSTPYIPKFWRGEPYVEVRGVDTTIIDQEVEDSCQ